MKPYFYYFGKTVLGLIAIAVFLYIYILNPENLNFSVEHHWIGVDVFWWILLVDLLWRFIPGSLHHIGQQKYLKRCFLPSKGYEATGKLSDKELEHKKTTDKRAAFVLLLFFFMNAVWLLFYCVGIFRPQELFGIMLLYFIGDMICVFGICPFRLIFMRNRCCNVCRIYNWDAIMLVTPLMLVPSFYSWSLGAIAIVYTLVWEISYHRHPERFYDSSNVALSCGHCKNAICPHRYKKNTKKKQNQN